MVAIDVPEATYAVITQRGALFDKKTGIGAMMRQVIDDWLPHSGYKRASTPDLEWYDERFSPEGSDSQMDIYIPIAHIASCPTS